MNILIITIKYHSKNKNQKNKQKIIYKEVDEEEEEEVEVYLKKNKPKQETLGRTLYKASTEHLRAVREIIRHNLTSCYNALI